MSDSHWGKISDIDVRIPSTYQRRTFLTFDIDWAHDQVIRDTHQLLVDAGICSTWFITHATPALDDLKADPNVEIGIHPNFNKLLEGDHSNGSSVKDVIQRLLEIAPEARSVRAHSLMQSSRILDCYAECGLTHDATHYIEPSFSESLSPWLHWNGIVRVPLIWEDDVAFIQDPGNPRLPSSKTPISRSQIRQLGFHPIHVFLNTENTSRYEGTRDSHQNPETLIEERFTGIGIRSILSALVANDDTCVL